MDVDIQEEPYVLINYYANNDQAGQVKTLTELCDLLEKIEFKENTKVIGGGGGDFDMLFNTALDADNTPSLKTNTLKKTLFYYGRSWLM